MFGEDEIFTPGDDFQESQTNDRIGLIPRTIDYLLNLKKDNMDSLELNCSFVDIYMDRIRDLGKTMGDSSFRTTKQDLLIQQQYEQEDLEIAENLSG